MSSDQEKETTDFNIPYKGVGVSKTAFLITISCVLGVILFIGILIYIYHQSDDRKPKIQNTMVVQQSGMSPEEAINQINTMGNDGSLVNIKTTQISTQPTPHLPTQPTAAQPPDNAMNSTTQQQMEAARSGISVINNFHGPAQLLDQVNIHSAQTVDGSNNNSPEGPNHQNSQDAYQNLNRQDEKIAFTQSDHNQDNQFYLNSKLTTPVSSFEIKAGTIIPATLLTGINSDLPGQITAQVSRNVYDTVTGNYLLIPQGTKVIGVYDSHVTFGQARVLIVWLRLITPNGDSFDLKNQPGVDLSGMTGLHDLVNNHTIRIFGSAILFSMFSAAGQLSQAQSSNGVLTNQEIIYGAIGQQMSQTGAQLIEKNMNIQPTVQIRSGDNFNILLTKDMVLPSAYQY